MVNCLWCGKHISKKKGSVRMYCCDSCKSLHFQAKRETKNTRKFNKDPKKFVMGMYNKTVVKPMKTKEESMQERIENKYGIDYSVEKNVKEIPRPNNVISGFYKDLLKQIGNLKEGENLKITIKKAGLSINTIRSNLKAHINRKYKKPNQIIMQKRADCLYVIRIK